TTIAAAEEASGHVVKSPLVGTFYAGAALDKPPFTAVGKRVSKGDTLFIIESMKLMNEVQSEFDGVVSKIMIESGQGVEFGQPILIIE
ncbi:MAG: biotin/lipoyl-containing protein, partial [Oscillospiraceae bacterium]